MKPWRLLAVVLCAIWGMLMVLPTFLTPSMRQHLPSWLPQRTITLGLDLRGGVHLALEVDTDQYIRERSQSIVPFLRQGLLKEKILYQNLRPEQNGASLTLIHPKDMTRFEALAARMDNMPLALTESENGKVSVEMPESVRTAMMQDVLNRSVEIVRKRIDETGALEPSIHTQGNNRIILQIPGFDDPQRVRLLLGKTAKLAFHWVGSKESLDCVDMPYQKNLDQRISVEKAAVMSGEEVLHSKGDYQANAYGVEKPVVILELTPKGRVTFADLTGPENHKRALAIVLDGEVLSTPVIQAHITGGSASISGSMTIEEAQQLATMVNSGALPAPLSILEEKVVGPGLGNDSIVAGTRGTLLAIVAVAVWMVMTYAYFGLFAVLGITFNLLFLVAILVLLGATLTLPGLAGIALTVGMSVDANVLINERIKEEWRQGHPVNHAITQGYARAMRSILDSNVTTLTGALLLYINGSGPVRGFAVTMGIGILISLFTAIGLTRMVVQEWVRWKKPMKLSI
jgi:preprotein translocase subunit SecD